MGSESQKLKQGQREEQFRQLFGLPTSEVYINEFYCALVKKVLLQGHLYLFDGYLCFYSNLFSVTKLVIKLDDVTYVKRAKTAGMFHVALEVVAGPTTYYFTSFLSREEAYKQIVTQWSKHSPQARFWLGTHVVENGHSNTISEGTASDVVEEPSPNINIPSLEGSSLRCESSESVNSDLSLPNGNGNGKLFTHFVEDTHQRTPSLEFPPGGTTTATLSDPLGEALFSPDYLNQSAVLQSPRSGKDRNSASFSSPDRGREVDSGSEEFRVLANSAGLLFSPRSPKNKQITTTLPHGGATSQPPIDLSELQSPDSQASVEDQLAYIGRTAGFSSAPPSPFPTQKDSVQQGAASVQVISGLTPIQSEPPETDPTKSVKEKEASQPDTPTSSNLKSTAQDGVPPGTPNSPSDTPGSAKALFSQLSPPDPAIDEGIPAEPSGVAQAVTPDVVGRGDVRETDAKIGGDEMDEEAPALAPTMRKVLVANFDVSVEDFFRLIFSDKSRERIDTFFKGRGEIDFECTDWAASDTRGKWGRLLTFRHPLGLLVGPKSAPCRQTQTLEAYRGGHYMVYTEQHMAELMFCDTFSVHGRWDVTPVPGSANPQCQVLISMDVPFSKPCWLKGKIERDAMSESKGMYEEWMKFAQEVVASDSAEKNPMPVATLESVDENSKRLLESLETKGVPVESQNEIRRMLQLPPLPVPRTWSETSLSDAGKVEASRGVAEAAEGSQEAQGLVLLLMACLTGLCSLVGRGLRKTGQGFAGNLGTVLACFAALQVAIFAALLFGKGYTSHLGGPSLLNPPLHSGAFPPSSFGVLEVPWTPPPDLRTALYWKHRISHMQAHLGFELERMEWHIQDMDGGKSGRIKGVGDKGEKGDKEYGYLWRKHKEK